MCSRFLTKNLGFRACNSMKSLLPNTKAISQFSSHSSSYINSFELPITSFSEEKLQLTLIMPGFSFIDLDKAGNPTMSYFAKFGESCRMLMYAPRMYPEKYVASDILTRLFKERKIFVVSVQHHFTPDMYDKSLLYKPIKVTEDVANVGKASLQHINSGVSLHTGKLLYRMVWQYVMVDPETHKAPALPDWFTELAKNTIKTDTKRVEKLPVPEQTLRTAYTFQESDCDFYHHVNQSRYPMFCHNAAAEFARNGKLSALESNLSRNMVRSFEGLYLRENEAGESVDIRVWENEEDPHVLNFDFFSPQKKATTFQGTYVFSSEITKSSEKYVKMIQKFHS